MRALIAAFAIVVAVAAPARADDELVEARRLQAALEYEQALVIVERAIAHGGADPQRLVELHVLAGTLAGGLDRTDDAEAHFAVALAIAPATTLPDGTSPKITAPFDHARAKAAPLGAFVAATRRSGDRIVSLDTYGNELFAEQVVARPPPPPPPPPRPRAHWPIAAIATGVALGAGALCAWRFQVAQDEWNTLRAEDGQHDYSQLVAVENRARAWAIGANVAFGVAAAGAIATSIVLVIDDRRRARVIVTPTALAVRADF